MGFPKTSLTPTLPVSFHFSEFQEEWREVAVTRFLSEVGARVTAALERVPATPGEFREFEESLHREIGQAIDEISAQVVRAAQSSWRVNQQLNQVFHQEPDLRCQERLRSVVITFLGGSQHAVSADYYLRRPPKGPGRPRGRGKRGPNGNGMYPTLELLGIHNRATPALASEATLQVTLGTIEQALEQIARRGIKMDRKRLLSISRGVGSRALRFREEVVNTGNGGMLGDVTGSRIVIGTDGGRLRTRIQKRRGRKKESTNRRGFQAPWREPKVLVIYEIDNDGRKLRKGGFRYYDATMGNADQTFEILAGVLLSIRAWRAREWIIVGDGARWIWERIDELVKKVGYAKGKVTEVVDLYHARKKLHEFAEEVKSFTKVQRKRWLNRMLRLLDNGCLKELEKEFSHYFKGCNSKKRRSLAEYFSKNKERMRYKRFRSLAIPMGSGAVESCVRRLVNLRLKGNGVFWRIDNAERLLHLRGQFLAGRWDKFVDQILQPVTFWKMDEQHNPPSLQAKEVA